MSGATQVAPASSPSLWDQLPALPLSSLQTPSNSQSADHQHKKQVPSSESEESTASVEAAIKGRELSPDEDCQDFNLFDVGVPWTQGNHLGTQVQRGFWLNHFRIPSLTSSSAQEDETCRPSLPAEVCSAKRKATNAHGNCKDATSKVDIDNSEQPRAPVSDRLRPRPKASTSVGFETEDDETIDLPTTQFFSRRVPRISHTSKETFDDEEDSGASASLTEVDERPAVEDCVSPLESSETSDADWDIEALRSKARPTSRLPSASPSAKDREGLVTPMTRRSGLAPLLVDLDAEKRAGYLAQLNDDAGEHRAITTPANCVFPAAASPTRSVSDPQHGIRAIHTREGESNLCGISSESRLAGVASLGNSHSFWDAAASPLGHCSANKSRNAAGMGMARKTWENTWREDGTRLVRGRLVKPISDPRHLSVAESGPREETVRGGRRGRGRGTARRGRRSAA